MTPNTLSDEALEQELAGLRREYERLKEDKVRTEQNVDNFKQQLDELEAQAKAEYGTADPIELQALLDQKRAENARLVADYQAHIATIHEALQNVEANIAPADGEI